MRLMLLVIFLGLAPFSASAGDAFNFHDAHRDLAARLDALHENLDAVPAAERLDAFITLYFDYTMLEYPTFATFIGHPAGHDRWADESFAGIKRRKADTVRALALVRDIDRSELTGDHRLNHDLLIQSLEESVASQRFLGDLEPLNQLGGLHQSVPRVLAVMPRATVQQYENVLARLEAVPQLVDDAIALMRKGLAQGVTPPKITLRDVPQQVLNLLPDEPLDSPLLLPFAGMSDTLDADDRKRLKDRALKVYADDLTPAFEKLHAFLVDEYVPGARQTIAMSNLPDGKAWYAHNVREMTTTDLTPQQIHDIGLREVKRIRGEMDKVITATGFDGNFEAFTEFLRTDAQFYHTSAEALVSGYRDIAKRADAALVSQFGKLPRLPYGVEPVPAYSEKSQTTAYYQQGSAEAARPGIFYANTYDLKARPKWEMEALTLHEAVPGHHLQIALAQEIEDLAWFRRFGGYTAFVEGWGLYSESLGADMGFYKDPYARFGQLTYEIWRAIRLVVDTGMHSLGWTRSQAIDYFVQNSGKTEHDIVVEIDRYIVWPGQALAYKIGELKIKELRARAEEALGTQFDIREFHDTLLGAGALPLSVLETRIDEWIAGKL